MRTSNKILAATFIAVLLIITGIHLALYAKYKNHDFITMKNIHEERYDSFPLSGIQSVSLSGLQRVTIISSDTAKLEIEKGGDRKLIYAFKNGILTIKGDTTITTSTGSSEKIRGWQDVIIYLPINQIVKSDDCEITFRGSADSSKAPSVTGEMNNTTLQFGTGEYNNNVPTSYFNTILLTKYSHGSFNVSQSVIIKEMNVNMEASSFEDNDASFEGIIINADKSSTLKQSGRNIAKTKFTLK
jgi:hypothetical protein